MLQNPSFQTSSWSCHFHWLHNLPLRFYFAETHTDSSSSSRLPRAIAPSPSAMATSPHRPYPLRGCAAPTPCSAMVGPCRPCPAWPRRRTAPAPQLVGSHGAVVVHHVHVPVIVPVQRIQPLLRRAPTAGAAPGSPVDRRRRVG